MAEIRSATLDSAGPPPGSPGSTPFGTWVGTAQVDACAGPICGRVYDKPRPFSLTVLDQGTAVAALLDMETNGHVIADLVGTREADGSIRLRSSAPSASVLPSDVLRFEIRTDEQGGLIGSFEYLVGGGPDGPTRVSGRLLSAERRVVALSPGNFEGAWDGDFIARECVGDCQYAGLGSHRSISLELSQTGASLTGWALFGFPVAGSVAGSLATVSGEVLVPVCRGDFEGSVCTQRLKLLSISVDRFGRMSGAIEYFKEGYANLTKHYTYTVKGDLVNVVRQY